MSLRPTRAHVLELKIGADTKEDMIQTLKNILFDYQCGQINDGCSGGVTSGASWKYSVDESITHEVYIKQLTEYLSNK